MADNKDKVERWRAKLSRELKTDQLDSYNRELSNGVLYEPFIDPEVMAASPDIPLPGEFRIGIRRKGQEEGVFNRLLHQLLPYDLGLIGIHADEDTDWDTMLAGIFPGMLHFDIEFREESSAMRFLEWRRKHSDTDDWSISSNMALPAGPGLICHRNYDFTGFNTAEQAKTLVRIVDSLNNSDSDHIKLSVNLTPNLLETLPFLRAVNKLILRHSKPGRVLLQAESDLDCYAGEKSNEQEIILAGTAAAWSVMSGISHLFFNVGEKNISNAEHQRLLLNIQNLFRLESKMVTSNDIIGGAYIIEDLSEKLIAKAGLN